MLSFSFALLLAIPGQDVWSAGSVLEMLPTSLLYNCISPPSGDEKRGDWACGTTSFDCQLDLFTITGSGYRYTRDCDGDNLASYDSGPDQITIDYDTKTVLSALPDYEGFVSPALFGVEW